MATSQDTQHVASRYAAALFDLTDTAPKRKKALTELQALQSLLSDSKEFTQLCTSPALGATQKLEAIKAVAKHVGVSKLTQQFLETLAINQRLDVLEAAVDKYTHLLRVANGEVVAEIETATKLPKKQQNDIAKLLETHTGKKIAVEVIENPAILGGLRIHVDGKMIDATVSGRLNRLKEELYNGIRQIA